MTGVVGNSVLRCDLCKVTMTDSNMLQEHFTGKRHMKAVRSVDLRARQEGKAIYVTKLGSLGVSELHAYFSTFGTVVNMAIGPNEHTSGLLHHIIVEFEEESAVLHILSKGMRSKHKVQMDVNQEYPVFQNIQVYERKFKAERERSPSPLVCPSLTHDQVKLRLALVTDPEEQLEQLVSLTYLSDEDVTKRVEICKNIQKTFSRSQYNHCVVYPFGSSVNGLGFPGCDLDIYIDLGEPKIVNITSSSSLLSDVPISMTEQQKVRASLKLLREIPQCARLQPILQARVPIIKFIHRPTGIHCDISFKNRSSVCNTEYIRFCTEIDSRVRPLLVAVRYFARHHDLAGGGGGMKMSNYALAMMVITYLQQLSPPILHSVRQLQNADPELVPDIVGGWNCAFSQDFNKLPSLPYNPMSTLELLSGFMNFYSNLDFSENLLCPLLGKVISKQSLTCPSRRESLFSDIPCFLNEHGDVNQDKPNLQLEKPFCLQDPFELTHNVCRNMPEKAVGRLNQYLQETSVLMSGIIAPHTETAGGLLAIFDDLEVPEVETENENILDKVISELNLSLVIDNFVHVKVKKGIFKQPFPSAGLQHVNETKLICDSILEMLTVSLGNCLKFDLVHVDESTTDEITEKNGSKRSLTSPIVSDKKPRLDDDGKMSSYSKGFTWRVWSQVWAGRKKIAARLITEGKLEGLSTIEKEIKVSDAVVEGDVRLTDPEVTFSTHLLVRNGEVEDCVWIGLEKVQSRKKSFESMLSWIVPYLKDLLGRMFSEKAEVVKFTDT